MLLQAFYPMSGPDGTEVAQDVDSESYPNGIILLEEGDKVTRSGYGLELAETEAILDARLLVSSFSRFSSSTLLPFFFLGSLIKTE